MKHFIIAVLAVVFFPLFFSGCSDNAHYIVQPYAQMDVSGRVYGVFHQPVHGLRVRIGDTIVTTGFDGGFSIPRVNLPYNLYIIDSVSKQAYLYPRVNTCDVSLFLDIIAPVPTPTANITVSASPGIIPPGSKIITGFTTGDDITTYDADLGTFPVRFGRYYNLVGKVFLIAYKENQNNEIELYEVFGAKDAEINAGGNYTFNFESADVINPGERVISGNVNLPAGYTESGLSYIYLMFGKKHSPNYVTQTMFTKVNAGAYSFALPEGISLPFTPVMVLFTQATQGSSQSYIVEARTVPVSGNTFNVTSTTAPVLTHPPDGAVLNPIDGFSYSGETNGSSNYIFAGTFSSNGGYRYKIFTWASGIGLEELQSFGLEDLSGRSFEWYVEKLGFVNSYNEFFTEHQRGIEFMRAPSQTRTFSIAP